METLVWILQAVPHAIFITGSLESVLKDINPVEPSVTSLHMDPYNYDETRRRVNGNISWRILEITRLYGDGLLEMLQGRKGNLDETG